MHDNGRRGDVTMDQQEWLAQRFEEHRPHLRAVAYRMLGSVSEADDAVQDAWIRLSRSDTSEVENLGAWLTTVVARVALNMLRSRKARHEQPLDVHVPDPIVDPGRRDRPRARGAPRRLGRPRPARRARDAHPARAPRVRPARHVRGAVRRDRDDPRPLARRGAPAREPRAPARARDRARSGCRPERPVGGRRSVPRRRSQRRLRRDSSQCSTPTSCSEPTEGWRASRIMSRVPRPSRARR